jgi:hypothetical protein
MESHLLSLAEDDRVFVMAFGWGWRDFRAGDVGIYGPIDLKASVWKISWMT